MFDDQIHGLMARAQVAWDRIHVTAFLMVLEPAQHERLMKVLEMHQSGEDYEAVIHSAVEEFKVIKEELKSIGVELPSRSVEPFSCD